MGFLQTAVRVAVSSRKEGRDELVRKAVSAWIDGVRISRGAVGTGNRLAPGRRTHGRQTQRYGIPSAFAASSLRRSMRSPFRGDSGYFNPELR